MNGFKWQKQGGFTCRSKPGPSVGFSWSALLGLFLMLGVFALFALGPRPALAQAGSPLGAEQGKAQSALERKAVGSIKTVTGLVNVQGTDGKIRFAAAAGKLFVGDVVNTQKNSTAVLEFIDTTQIALRPASRFVVENFEYQPETPIADKAEFRLVKGGLRTLTGLVGKRGNADAFAMKSETATIGIRGTDFTARVCRGNECARPVGSEVERASVTNTSMADVAGRVSQLSGSMTATTTQGKSRNLVQAAAVFAGETIAVAEGGFAVLSMADGTRLTLPGGSSMAVTAYRYVPTSPQTSVASFKLLKGALRAVTGAIAKAEPNNVKFFTDTATVGIRGTALDLSCTTAGEGGLVFVQCSNGANFTVEMRDGQVVISSGTNNVLVAAGQAASIAAGQLNVRVVNGLPNLLNQIPNPGPVPENTPANFETLSASNTQALQGAAGGGNSDQEADLFVAVNDGTVVVSNANQTPIEVRRGEGAVVRTLTNLAPVLLVAPPDIIIRDNTLAAPPFTAPQCAP